MQYSSLIGHSAELCRIIEKSSQTSDSIAAEYLRSKKYLGSTDRKIISEMTFQTLRILTLAKAACPPPLSPDNFENNSEYLTVLAAQRLIAVLSIGEALVSMDEQRISIIQVLEVKYSSVTSSDIEQWVVALDNNIGEIQYLLANPDKLQQLPMSEIAEILCIQSWILEEWLSDSAVPRNFQETIELCMSLWRGASVGLRVQGKTLPREQIIALLNSQGIVCAAGKYSPSAIILHQRKSLQAHPLYLSGAIEIQDEGSQIIGFSVLPNTGDIVMDTCAGAGGKTLQLAEMAGRNGEIIATDIEWKRLKEVPTRAKKAGLRNIKTQLLAKNSEKELKQYIGKCDYVLVDAPCSGIGTARRNPIAKYRITPELIQKLKKKQLSILEKNIKYVKTGGILVYATCSLIPAENSGTIAQFLENNKNFSPDPLQPVFDASNIDFADLNPHSNIISLSPEKYNTDGFFIARFKRIY